MSKNRRNKVIGVLLVLALLISQFYGINFEKVQAEGTGYTELTFSSFGIADQTVTSTVSGSNATVTANGLDKVAFSGYVTIPSADTSNYIQFGNLLRLVPANNNQFGVWNNLSSGWFGWSSDIGKVLVGNKVLLRLEFDASGDNYTMKIYLNGSAAGSVTLTGGVSGFTTRTLSVGAVSGASYAIASYTEPTGDTTDPTFTEVTFADFGFADGAYTASQSGKSTTVTATTGLDKVAFIGYVTFPENGTADWTNEIRIGNALKITPLESDQSYLRLLTGNNAALGTTSTLGSSVMGRTIKLRVEFTISGTADYKAVVYVDDAKVADITCTGGVAKWIEWPVVNVGVKSGETMTIGSYPERTKTFTEVSFNDFGIVDQTVFGSDTSAVSFGGKNATVESTKSLVNYAFTGYVRFPTSDTANWTNKIQFGNLMYITPTSATTIQLKSTADNSNYSGAINCGSSMLGNYIKLRLEFEQSGANYMVTVYVDDVKKSQVTISGGIAQFTYTTLLVTAGANQKVSVKSEPNNPPAFTEMTFSDFQMANQTVVGGATESKLVSSYNASIKTSLSLSNVAFTGHVKFPSNYQVMGDKVQFGSLLYITPTSETAVRVLNPNTNASYTDPIECGKTIVDKYLKFRLEFLVSGDDYHVTLYLDDVEAAVFKITGGVTQFQTYTALVVQAGAGYHQVAVKSHPLVLDKWEVSKNWDPYTISHRDFKDTQFIADGKYSAADAIAVKGAYTAHAAYEDASAKPTTLEGTMLDTDITFHGNAELRYGGTDANGWSGVQIAPNSDGTEMTISWQQDGVEAHAQTITAASVEVQSFQKKFNLRISFDVIDADEGGTDNDIKVGVYINKKMATGDYIYFNNYGEYLGNNFGLYTKDKEAYVILELPAIDEEAYTMATTTDFDIGSAYSVSDNIGKYKHAETLDGVAFTAFVDFKDAVNDGNQSDIRYAGSDTNRWAGLRFFESKSGIMSMSTNLMLLLGYTYDTSWGFEIPESGEFHLAILTDYVDYDLDSYKDDIRVQVRINGEMQHSNFFLQDAAIFVGTNAIYHAANPKTVQSLTRYDEFVVRSSPYVEDLGTVAYNLEKIKKYTVPGTDKTYNTTGIANISYQDGYTRREEDVIFYRTGDINADNIIGAGDIVRAKKQMRELTITDVANWNKLGAVAPGGEVKDVFAGVSTLAGTAVEFKMVCSDSANSTVRFGGAHGGWTGICLFHEASLDKIAFAWQSDNGRIDSIYYAPQEYKDGAEVIVRMEFVVEDDDLRVELYINGEHAIGHTYAGKANALTNQILVHNDKTATQSLQLKDSSDVEIYKRAADMNEDGDISPADAYDQIYKTIFGEEIEKGINFGAISDIHLTGQGGDSDRQLRMKKALKFYRDQGVDVLIFNSDITDFGLSYGYKVFIDIIQDVYKDTPEKEMPKLLITGDGHEYFESWTWLGNTLTMDEMLNRFVTDLAPLGVTQKDTSFVVNGYSFIGVTSDDCLGGPAYYSDQTLAWLEAEVAAAVARDSEKPIFVAIHQTAGNTVAASDGLNAMTSYPPILEKYPQVVLFTSHTHVPLEDEHQIFQGKYTVVNTSTLYYAGSFGRDGQGSSLSFANVDFNDLKSSPYTIAQGLLVKSRGKRVNFDRYDFLHNETIKQPWTIENVKTDRPYSLARFNLETEKPVFPSNAKATMTRSGTTCTITVDAATHSEFVYYYQVTGSDGSSWNLITDFWQGIPYMKDKYTFTITNVPTTAALTICAVDPYGNKSASLAVQ